MAKFGLGKGLGALIPEHQQFFEQTSEENPESIVRLVPIDALIPNPDQPRKTFSQESLDELAESIRRHGLLQPLLVHELAGGKYSIIAGERRYRAAQIAGIEQLPVIVRSDTPDDQRLELSLVENIQREDLDPIEEALAFARLMEVFGATQERVAEMVGKSRVAVANTMRLLKLSEPIQAAIKQGVISSGHARALLAIDDPQARDALFDRIRKGNLSVRQAEQEAQKLQSNSAGVRGAQKRARDTSSEGSDLPLNPLLKNLREHLIERFGTKVEISGDIDSGLIKIQYYSQEDLQRIYDVLGLE